MRILFIAAAWALGAVCHAQDLTPPPASRQLVLGVGASTDSSTVSLQRYSRADGSAPWAPVGPPIAARIGRRGMAWGIGLHLPAPAGQRTKREGDWRAPMGVFRIGDAFGDAVQAPAGADWPYTQVTANDLWVEDVEAPTYNQYIRVPSDRPRTEWEESQRMKMGDAAHRLKIVIHHNTEPEIRPGAGSAIFFHIWRADGAKPTSGCTAMPEADILTMLRWLSAAAAPVYVLTNEAGASAARLAGELP